METSHRQLGPLIRVVETGLQTASVIYGWPSAIQHDHRDLMYPTISMISIEAVH